MQYCNFTNDLLSVSAIICRQSYKQHHMSQPFLHCTILLVISFSIKTPALLFHVLQSSSIQFSFNKYIWTAPAVAAVPVPAPAPSPTALGPTACALDYLVNAGTFNTLIELVEAASQSAELARKSLIYTPDNFQPLRIQNLEIARL